MGQHYFHIHPPTQDHPSLIRLCGQIHQVSNQPRNLGAINPALREHPPDNRILVSIRDIAAGDNHIVQKESRVGTVLAGIGDLPLRQRRMQPLGLNDGDEGLVGGIVDGEINSITDQMGEFFQWWEGRWRFVDD